MNRGVGRNGGDGGIERNIWVGWKGEIRWKRGIGRDRGVGKDEGVEKEGVGLLED